MKRWTLLVSCWLVTFSLSAQGPTGAARQRALGYLHKQILPNLDRDGPAYWLFNEHGQPRRIKYDGGLDSKCFCSDNLFGVPRREIKGQMIYAKRKLHHYLGYAEGNECDDGCDLFMGDSITALFSEDDLAVSTRAADAGEQRILISLSSAFCGQGYCAVRIALASQSEHKAQQIYFYLVMKSASYSLADWWYIVPYRLHPR